MIDAPAVAIVSAPTGRLDEPAGEVLIESIKEHIARSESDHIVDLRGVDKVDARTIRVMISIHRHVSETGGSLRLVIEDAKALRYITLTALRRVLGVYGSTEAALAGIASDDRNANRTETRHVDGTGPQDMVH